MATRRARRGFTLVEVLLVLAVLLILAAVILPSVSAFRGDTRHRAAADAIRGEMAIARSRAMEEGRPYRVSINESGTRLRRGPEDAEFVIVGGSDPSSATASAVDFAFDHVTAEVTSDSDLKPEAVDGWVTVATLQPDGSCREDGTLVLITEPKNGTLRVRVRGITGSARVVPNTGAK